MKKRDTKREREERESRQERTKESRKNIEGFPLNSRDYWKKVSQMNSWNFNCSFDFDFVFILLS